MTIVAIHDPGYEIKRKYNDLCIGKNTNIHKIRIPTVPIIESIIGIVEYPIPLNAPGNRSIIPQKKYGTVVMDKISSPHFITSASDV